MTTKRLPHYNYLHQGRFNVIAYVHNLHKAGLSQEAAEIQGEFATFMTERIFVITKTEWQDLKGAVEQNRQEISLLRKDLNYGLESVSAKSEADIAAISAKLDVSIANMFTQSNATRFGHELRADMQKLDAKIDRLDAKIEQLRSEVKEMIATAMTKTTYMMMGFTGAMLSAMAKGFHWI